MKICSFCGRQNPDAADRCFECGSPQALKSSARAKEKGVDIGTEAPSGQCSYCGLENPEQAQYCAGCGTQLSATLPTLSDAGAADLMPESGSGLQAIDPENPWTAKDAWKCLGMFILFEFILGQIWRMTASAFPGVRSFYGTGAGHLTIAVVHYAVLVLNALYFARTESMQTFLKAFGLANSPTRYAWFAVAATLLIRAFGHFIVSRHWARGATTISLWGFSHSRGLEAVLYLIPALMAPFAEEIYMRGFFYRAFRGSYPVVASTLLILAITAMTHWNQFYRSWIAVAEISAITVLQCFLRERTGNLRDCILCHLVFNASGALLSLRAH